MDDLTELEVRLAAQEETVGGLRPGCAKQVVWADGPRKTPHALVYIHGFSASSGEVRPLTDLVADAFGANTFYTRLSGHGQDGAAMGRATLDEWHADVTEALQIGQEIGEEVIVMGCSTGCTLLTTALARGAKPKAILHVAPNFGLRNPAARLLLRMPGVRHWGKFIVGKETSFDPISDAHQQYWTTRYDTAALFTMDASVQEAHAAPVETIQTPAYVAYAETDQVVNPAQTKRVMARWGGPVTWDVLVQGPEDDKDGHVMAGDVFSPRQTAPLAERMIAWIRGL